MRHWKRSDISQELVLDVFSRPFKQSGRRDEELIRKTGAPAKVVWAAMQREDGRGFIDYGVNLRGGWLTPEGEARLAEIKKSHTEES